MKKYLTDRQIGEMYGGKSTVTVWRWRKAGKLPPAKKVNGQNLTDLDEIDPSRIFDDETGTAA